MIADGTAFYESVELFSIRRIWDRCCTCIRVRLLRVFRATGVGLQERVCFQSRRYLTILRVSSVSPYNSINKLYSDSPLI